MENYASLVPLVILLPFAGLLINLFLGKTMSERTIGLVASLAAGSAFAVAAVMAIAATQFHYDAVVVNPPLLDSWILVPSAALNIPWQLRVDTLSLTMMLVVTGVGTLIHIYAVGYMHGDPRFARFFVYLNLFLGFMLVLVTGNNFLVMFVGWEGVGLCSFLLIGFWFDKTRGEGWRNSNAARKAFIVNRIGDFGLLMAIFLIFWTFGTLDFYKPGEQIRAGHAAEAVHAEGAVAEGAVVDEAAAAEGEHAAPAETESHGEAAGEAGAALTPNGSGQMGVFPQAEKWLEEGGHVVHFGPFSLPFDTVVTLITLFMLVGVTGKSAQIPLFVWLPDAMAGPTPVSALIHAATMVTAGVYLITRNSVLYHAAPLSSAVVTLVGTATAIVAGYIALGQWDIKRVLAYSTVSQLGFMVAAAGLGGYTAAMFHLITHAFFKALLFLGSGSVIHGVEHGHHHVAHAHGHGDGHDDHDEHREADAAPFDPQDMRNMGGLRKRMPVTYWTYLIGTFALAGIVPLSGFWSKDEILGKALKAGFTDGRFEGFVAFALLLAAAGFTAFYMWRQVVLIFFGPPRSEAAAHAPESSPLMTAPLVILAVLAAVGGLLNIPAGVNLLGWPLESLTVWLEQSVPYAAGLAFNPLLAIVATLISIGAIALANVVYMRRPVDESGRDVLELSPSWRGFFRLANARLYWDEFYFRLFENPYNRASKWLADQLDWELWHNRFHNNLIRDNFNRFTAFLTKPVDRGAIDQGFLAIGRGVVEAGKRLRLTQTGYIRTYVFTMLLGVVLVVIVLLLPYIRQLLGQ